MSLTLLLLPIYTAILLIAAYNRVVQLAVVVAGSVLTFVLSFGAANAPIDGEWLPALGIHFALEGGGARGVLVSVAAFVMIPTLLYALMRVKRNPRVFVGLMLIMQAGLNGIFLAQDLVLFYVCWEFTLIPSLALLAIWGGTARRQAMLQYLIYAVTGSLLMLISILAMRPLSGAATYRFDDLLAVTPDLAVSTQIWLFLGFTVAFAVKVPLFPLHSWLIDFHEQNHPSGTADVMGTLYKVGGWGFFAWALPLLPGAAVHVAPILMLLAVFTALYGALVALKQTNLKRFLAYASLSHMGVVGAGIFGLHLSSLSGGIFLLAAQMLSTSALFLLSGMLHARRNTFTLVSYGGVAKSAPLFAGLFLFTLLASIGVPGLSNFPGEFMSFLGVFQGSIWLGVLITLVVIPAGMYGVNLYQLIFQGQQRFPMREISAAEMLILTPLLLAMVWLGLNPNVQYSAIETQAALIATQHPDAQGSVVMVPPQSSPPTQPQPIVAVQSGGDH